MNHIEFFFSSGWVQVSDRRNNNIIIMSILIEPNGVSFEKAWSMIGDAVKVYLFKQGIKL